MVSSTYLIGVGMGNPATLTQEARDAIAHSSLVIGSPRLVADLAPASARSLALVSPEQIAQALREAEEGVASVLMSGDVGFYSGATRLYPLLEGLNVRAIPGVSSLSYLCARLQTPWQDVHVVSAHGRSHNAAGAVQAHARTFVLAGGDDSSSVAGICAQLAERGLGELRVHVGERLSYADERITSGTAAELATRRFDALAAMLVVNPRPIAGAVRVPQLDDDAFVRNAVPMTKREVRQLALCRLQIRPADVVWDVGAGTGSVSVEAARAACEGLVLAVERDGAALALLEQNRQRFGLPNLRIVAGAAPEALAGLERPDRVFVGGSSGALTSILRAAIEANPSVVLCVTAVTLETLSELLAAIRELDLREVDIAQVSVARSREAGAHHLMRAANPVYLVSAMGPGTGAGEAR